MNADLFPCYLLNLYCDFEGIHTSYIAPNSQLTLEVYKRSDTGFIRNDEFVGRNLVTDEDYVFK